MPQRAEDHAKSHGGPFPVLKSLTKGRASGKIHLCNGPREGAGDFFCDFGHMSYRDGDYIMIPRGTMWRLEPSLQTVLLMIEARDGAAARQALTADIVGAAEFIESTGRLPI